MLKHKMLAVAAVLVSTMASVGAYAADTAGYSGPLPAALKRAKESGGLDVYKDFPAAGGLKGWVVQDKATSKYVVVYTTPDGSVLLAGMALDTEGQNLTSVYASQFVPATDYTPAYKAFTSEASTVVWGSKSAKAEMTIVMDPTCHFCQLLERMVKPSVDNGSLRVRLVPVAILGGDAPQKAAGLLTTNDVNSYMAADITGGQVATSGDPMTLGKVEANNALMRKYGFNGTPAVFYKSGKGKDETLNVSNGVPNMTEMFGKLGLTNDLAKLKEDPALSKYLR